MGLISRVSSRTYRNQEKHQEMADYAKDNKVAEAESQSNIRITISATNPKSVDKACSEITGRAKQLNNNAQSSLPIKIKGPRPMPTRRMRITTRKTPCGEGSKTWDRYQMRIHKRIIEFECAHSQILQITHIKLEPGVHVELTLPDSN